MGNRMSRGGGAAPAKKLLNDPKDACLEMLDGLVMCQPGLALLDGFPGVKVVVRKGMDPSKVALISGGGSGHEPAHAGYVGPGMLSAAVCGEVFASPSTEAVYCAIKAVTGAAGCLLIVKNYTGDRLNFGLAAERAKQEGLMVEMVVVGEDCALPPPLGIAGRRGLAGTVLVHKVAGAAAERGLSLAAVREAAQGAADRMGTMGAALTVCALPGAPPPSRLGAGEMELGLGIHGEPGAEKGPVRTVDQVVGHVLDCITDPQRAYLPLAAGERVVLLVNSLGATTPMELHVAARAALPRLKERGAIVEGVLVGHLMTALDMSGLSLTVMKVDNAALEALRTPSAAPAWPGGAFAPLQPIDRIPIPKAAPVGGARPATVTAGGALLEKCVVAAADKVAGLEDDLTKWDAAIGDGDCGATMAKGAAAVRQAAARGNVDDAAAIAGAFAAAVSEHMGGTSGAIYAIFFSAAAAALKGAASPCTASQWSSAFSAAVDAVTKYGGAGVGARTMVDALHPAAEALAAALAAGKTPAAAAGEAAAAAEAGAAATKSMDASAGRASYVRKEALAAVPDPGAMAAATWIRAVAAALA